MASIRDGVHSGWCPFGMVSIRNGVHSEWCPFGIVSIRNCPFGMVSIWDGVHLGWCPFGMVYISNCVHSGLCPFGIASIRDRVQDPNSLLLFSLKALDLFSPIFFVLTVYFGQGEKAILLPFTCVIFCNYF